LPNGVDGIQICTGIFGRVPGAKTAMHSTTDPASAAAAAALESDPFYRCITVEFAADIARRRAALRSYLDYSIAEGMRIGRVVHLEAAESGVAIWLLPQIHRIQELERTRKRAFLHQLLGESGCANYHGIVEYMSNRARALVGSDAWYLSIVAVARQQQGCGLGARLLAPTLAEADAAGVVCYLETFSLRSRGFYERLEFLTRAEFAEPTTAAHYAIMTRLPRSARGRRRPAAPAC
jgi:GNAT superfamily N-acetyltransferase